MDLDNPWNIRTWRTHRSLLSLSLRRPIIRRIWTFSSRNNSLLPENKIALIEWIYPVKKEIISCQLKNHNNQTGICSLYPHVLLPWNVNHLWRMDLLICNPDSHNRQQRCYSISDHLLDPHDSLQIHPVVCPRKKQSKIEYSYHSKYSIRSCDFDDHLHRSYRTSLLHKWNHVRNQHVINISSHSHLPNRVRTLNIGHSNK